MRKRFTMFIALMVALMTSARIYGQAYQVVFETPMQYCTCEATLNGNPFSGGEVQLNDYLVVSYHAFAGRLFEENGQNEYVVATHLVATMFDEFHIYGVYSMPTYVADLQFHYERLVNNAVRLSWTNSQSGFDMFRLCVSETEQKGNPDYWKGVIQTPDEEYVVGNLVDGVQYYAYIQGGKNGLWEGEVFSTTFVYREPNPCVWRIKMKDAYGDGWNGNGLVFVENGQETFVTLESGASGTAIYTSSGYRLQVKWKLGEYPDEVSFVIYEDNDYSVMEVDEVTAAMLTDGEVLYEGIICPGACSDVVENLAWKVDGTGTQYTVTWDAESYVDKFQVAVVQKSNPTLVDLEDAAVTVSENTYTFTGKKHAYYNVYVRTICDKDEYGAWCKLQVADVYVVTDIQALMVAEAGQVALDYVERDELFATAFVGGKDADSPYPFRFFKFSVKDSTDVQIAFMLSGYYDHTIQLYQDTAVGKPLALLADFEDGMTFRLKGDYYVLLGVDPDYLGEYTFLIQAVKSLNVTPIGLNETVTGDFQNVFFGEINGIGAFGYQVGYSFVPSDTMRVAVKVASNNMIGGVLMISSEGRLENVYNIISNGIDEMQLIKDTTYYFVMASSPNFHGNQTDTYKLTLVPLSDQPTVATDIAFDYVAEDSFGKNDLVNELGGVNGKVYHALVKEPGELAFSFELTGGSENDPIAESTMLFVYADSISGVSQVAEFYAYYPGYSAHYLSADAAGTHYYFVIMNLIADEVSYRINLRKETDWKVVPERKNIQVSTRETDKLTVLDHFATPEMVNGSTSGSFKVYGVDLEKDKHYKFFVHMLPETSESRVNDEFRIALLDPKATGSNYNDHLLNYSTTVADDWAVMDYTPTESGNYPIVIAASDYSPQSEEAFAYEFSVEEVTDLEGLYMASPVVPLPNEFEGVFSNNVKVVRNSSYYFHNNAKSYIEENGAFDAVGFRYKLAAGDTLYVEFGGDADAMIHIYNMDDPSYPVIINDVPYAYPYEYGFYVNEDAVEHEMFVVCSFVDVELGNLGFVVRGATKQAQMAKKVVTLLPVWNSITVYEDATVPSIQAELSLLELRADDGQNNVIKLENNPYNWVVDLDEAKASYELNDSDLPMGYTFDMPCVRVEVMINFIPKPVVGVENVEDATVERVTKVLRNGQLLIRTLKGTFDVMGRRVE